MSSEEAAPTVDGDENLPKAGQLKWYNAEKGYGFITVKEDVGDVFLHVKELRKSGIVALNDGTPLSFTTSRGPKGLFATDIKVISDKSP